MTDTIDWMAGSDPAHALVHQAPEEGYEDVPVFDVVRRGYDRAQVEQHLALVQDRLLAAEGDRERLLAEHVALAAERDRLLSGRPDWRELGGRVAEILRLSDEQAEEIIQRARQEADDTLRTAQAEATRTKDETERLVTLAQEQADRLRGDARAQTDALLADAQAESDALRQQAQREAAAEEQLAAARVAELERQRDLVRAELEGMRDRLAAFVAPLQSESAGSGSNVFVRGPAPRQAVDLTQPASGRADDGDDLFDLPEGINESGSGAGDVDPHTAELPQQPAFDEPHNVVVVRKGVAFEGD